MRRVFRFLGVGQPVTVGVATGARAMLKKSQSGTLREKIINFDEVEAKLRGTRWEHELYSGSMSDSDNQNHSTRTSDHRASFNGLAHRPQNQHRPVKQSRNMFSAPRHVTSNE